MREHVENKSLELERRFWHASRWSRGLISAGRQVVRSENDGGPDGLATVGCDQAVGSPKGEAPVASATQRCKQSPTSPLRRQARVRYAGVGSEGHLAPDRTAPSLAPAAREWSYAHPQGSHQRPSSREQAGLALALGRPFRGLNHRSDSLKQRAARQKPIAAPRLKNSGAPRSTPIGRGSV